MRTLLLTLLLTAFSTVQAKEVYATFTVFAKKSANLAFNYSGIVKEYNVDIMSEVKKGDVLATLVADDLIATNNASKVTLKYAKLDYKRYQELLKKKLIDKAQLDKYAMAYEAIQAHIKLEETIYDKTILRAPFDGVITKRMIELGDVVSGQMLRTAFVIQSTHKRILVAEFDQKYTNDVKIGDAFIYHVDGDVREYKGKVFRIYPTVNEKTRKVSVQVAANDIKVGLFGDGVFITSDSADKE